MHAAAAERLRRIPCDLFFEPIAAMPRAFGGATLAPRIATGSARDGRLHGGIKMRTIVALAGVLVLLAGLPLRAGELDVSVDDGHAHPVADAVVTLRRQGDAGPGRPPEPVTRTIDQKDLTFIPYLEIFRPGDQVVFRNSDRTRHHVYSFSPVKTFEFVLVPGQSSDPLKLDKTGVVAVGCNIHDGMISYLYVSDAPWIARSDARGTVVFHGLPAGTYDVRVWQPRLRPGLPDIVRPGVVLRASDTRTLAFPLLLLPDSRHRPDHEHAGY